MTRGRRLVVVWRVTEACDLDCAYCEFRRSRRGPRHSASAATALTFGRVLGEWQAATGREVLLSWLGGEPLRWGPVWAVSRELRQAHGLSLSVTTNGTELSQAGRRQQLVEDFAEVTLSVDGDAAAHEAVRGAGRHAALRAVIEDLRDRKAALGHGPVLRVNTVLRHSNLTALDALGSELAAWGVEELTFNALGGAPDDAYYAAEHLRPADLDWLAQHFDSLRAQLAAQGLRVRGSQRYVRRLEYTARGWRWPVADCAPGDRLWFVDEQARLSPCRFTSAEYGVPLAALTSLEALGEVPARLAAARRQRLTPACADCHSPQYFGKFALEGA
ncbi:MAG: radical SAM protein [Anaerolineales bacterium]|nr:radical SAM protein [Anaerolineales bacterium]